MDIEYLNELRRYEMGQLIERYSPLLAGKRVLEIGSGTGEQLRQLSKEAASVVGLDIAASNYREHSDSRIVMYDGHHIPFPDESFDTVYSSSVLEHVAHRDAFQQEIRRVLRTNGHCLHALPAPAWKLGCMLVNAAALPYRIVRRIVGEIQGTLPRFPRTGTALLDLVLGNRHGEFGNTFTELREFSPSVWEEVFRRNGWRVLHSHSAGLFYGGYGILNRRLGLETRKMLAPLLGSACHVYVLEKRAP